MSSDVSSSKELKGGNESYWHLCATEILAEGVVRMPGIKKRDADMHLFTRSSIVGAITITLSKFGSTYGCKPLECPWSVVKSKLHSLTLEQTSDVYHKSRIVFRVFLGMGIYHYQMPIVEIYLSFSQLIKNAGDVRHSSRWRNLTSYNRRRTYSRCHFS